TMVDLRPRQPRPAHEFKQRPLQPRPRDRMLLPQSPVQAPPPAMGRMARHHLPYRPGIKDLQHRRPVEHRPDIDPKSPNGAVKQSPGDRGDRNSAMLSQGLAMAE